MTKYYARKKSGMVKSKNGKYYYPKKRNNRRNGNKGGARRTAMSIIPTLLHETKVENSVPFGDVVGSGDGTIFHWTLIKPLHLSGATAQGTATNRSSNKIWVNNYKVDIEIMPNKTTVGCFVLRIQKGIWFGTNTVTTQELTNSIHSVTFDTVNSKFNPKENQNQAYKLLSDVKSTHYPIQIYDENGSDDRSLQSELMRGLHKPIKRTIRWTMNRQFNYSDADGDSMSGGVPFIAIGCFPCHGTVGFTATGPNQSPNVEYESKLYFKNLPME